MVVKVWFAVCCEVIMYTKEELASTHYMYGLADSNALEVHRLYWERYPTRRLPDRKTSDGSIAAYANTGVLHVHQAPGDGQEV
jgi:hypothetical protein